LSIKRNIFEIFDFKNAVTLKTVLGVREIENLKCHNSIERIGHPINVSWQLEWWGYRADKEVWRYLQPSE